MSYYDFSADEPEKSYHLLVLGMLNMLSDSYFLPVCLLLYHSRRAGLSHSSSLVYKPRPSSIIAGSMSIL